MSRLTARLAPTQKQAFNRSFFDRSDPAELIGIYLPPFSMYHLYSDVDPQKLSKICPEVYKNVLEKLGTSAPQHVQASLITFSDAKYETVEGSRDYIVVSRETPRKTRATVLARCLTYGENVYLSVDSYALGSLNRIALLTRLFYSFIFSLFLLCPLACAIPGIINALAASFSPFSGRAPNSGSLLGTAVGNVILPFICCAIPVLALQSFLWLDVIRGFSQHKDIVLALRQAFNYIPNDESFNLDDMFMFFKTVLPIMLYSIKDVFKENDIEVKTLDDFIERVNNINNINVSTGGGNIFGSIFGGSSHQVNAAPGQGRP